MDMRFASTGAKLGSQEAAIGIFAGVGAIPYLTRAIGMGRAAEYLLSAQDIDATTAEKFGWVNQAFSAAADMQKYTDALAARIGLFPAQSLAATKASIRKFGPAQTDLDADKTTTLTLGSTSVAQDLFDKWLALSNDQKPGLFESGLMDDLTELYQ